MPPAPNKKSRHQRQSQGHLGFGSHPLGYRDKLRGKEKSPEDVDAAIARFISRAVASTEVVDIFAAAGLKKPDISISRTISSPKCAT